MGVFPKPHSFLSGRLPILQLLLCLKEEHVLRPSGKKEHRVLQEAEEQRVLIDEARL